MTYLHRYDAGKARYHGVTNGRSESTLCYLRQGGGYVFIGVSQLVCLLAGSQKNYSTNFHKILLKGDTSATEETFRF